MASFGNAEEAHCVSPSPDVSAHKLNAFVRVTSPLVAATACGMSGITHDCVSSVTTLAWLTQSQVRLTEVLARASPCFQITSPCCANWPVPAEDLVLACIDTLTVAKALRSTYLRLEVAFDQSERLCIGGTQNCRVILVWQTRA